MAMTRFLSCTLACGELDKDSVCCGLCQGILQDGRLSSTCADHFFCLQCREKWDIDNPGQGCPHPTCTKGPGSMLQAAWLDKQVNAVQVRCPTSETVAVKTVKAWSPFDDIHVTMQDVQQLCTKYCIGQGMFHPSKEKLVEKLAEHFTNPEALARELQELNKAERPRSVAGAWDGFTGDYEDRGPDELREEAFCEGLSLQKNQQAALTKRRAEVLEPLFAGDHSLSQNGVGGWDASLSPFLFVNVSAPSACRIAALSGCNGPGVLPQFELHSSGTCCLMPPVGNLVAPQSCNDGRRPTGRWNVSRSS